MGSRLRCIAATLMAHGYDIVAPKVPLCARRDFLAESDASRNWIKVCSDFWNNCRARESFFRGLGRSDASVCVAARSSERGKSIGELARPEKIAQKRNERSLMRCRAGLETCRTGKRAG